MKRFALSIVFCLLSVSAAVAQTKSPVEGVWKVAEVVAPGGETISNPQPGLMIFTKGYYSQLFLRGTAPRPAVEQAKDPQKLTDAEKIALFEQWRPFTANAGTFEIKGTTLSMKAVVAKSAQLMAEQRPREVTFKLEGTNTLWIIGPAGATESPRKLKLTRLE